MISEGVGDRVRRFRRHRGLTQQALADLAAIDKGYISRLEAGEIADPGVDLVERLSSALQVSMRQGAILAIPASCLSDDDKEAIIRFVRKLIAAKSAAVMALGLAVGGPGV